MDLDRFWTATDWHEAANERAYDAPADPRRLVCVDPAEIERFASGLRLDAGLGRVQGGDWDHPEHCGPIRETAIYRGLVQRFVDGADWTETALYERAARRFDEGERVRGYESVEAFRRRRCAYLDDLYESIRAEGYRPNRDAAHDNPAAAENPYEDAYAHYLEPIVAIGRTGEVLLTEGYHRFAIADILDVGEIPVQVLSRHREWQRVRDAVAVSAAEELPDDLSTHLGHPDFGDLDAGPDSHQSD